MLAHIHRPGYPSLALAIIATLTFAAACSGGGVAELADAGVSAEDVPADWQLADIEDASGQPIFDILPDLLVENADAHLLLRAYEADSGLHGAATMFIETGEATALPETNGDDDVLEPLSRLLVRQDEVLIPRPLGGDPGAYFSVSDALPGALRSRLVRIVDEGTVYSDSLTFTVGRVLAVVTVWYPEQDDPVVAVEALALEVEQRLGELSETG